MQTFEQRKAEFLSNPRNHERSPFIAKDLSVDHENPWPSRVEIYHSMAECWGQSIADAVYFGEAR